MRLFSTLPCPPVIWHPLPWMGLTRLSHLLLLPALGLGCSCSSPHCSEGKLIVKTVVKVLVNHSVLKNTSKNGFIINGPAVSTMKSRLSSEARIFLNETVLVQSSSISIWKRILSQIIRPNIEKSRQISKAKDTQEVGLGNLLFFSRFTQSY